MVNVNKVLPVNSPEVLFRIYGGRVQCLMTSTHFNPVLPLLRLCLKCGARSRLWRRSLARFSPIAHEHDEDEKQTRGTIKIQRVHLCLVKAFCVVHRRHKLAVELRLGKALTNRAVFPPHNMVHPAQSTMRQRWRYRGEKQPHREAGDLIHQQAYTPSNVCR